MASRGNQVFALGTPLPELPTCGVASFVQALADQYGVTAARNALDDWADKASSLSGDNVNLGEFHQLLVNLRRAHIITSEQLAQLHLNHRHEHASVRDV